MVKTYKIKCRNQETTGGLKPIELTYLIKLVSKPGPISGELRTRKQYIPVNSTDFCPNNQNNAFIHLTQPCKYNITIPYQVSKHGPVYPVYASRRCAINKTRLPTIPNNIFQNAALNSRQTGGLEKGLTCHVRKQIEPLHGVGISPDQLTGIILIIVD